MVSAGDVIENPVTGERIHLRQEEKFEVLDGRIMVRVQGEESVRGPGEVVVVPAGAAHSWAPDGGRALIQRG